MPETKRPIIYYIATSLDGYIADKNGGLDWLYVYEDDYTGYEEVYKTMDTIIMGRTTYDWILEHGHWSYNKKCYVFTHREDQPQYGVEFVRGDVGEFAAALQKQDGSNIWLMGGAALADAFIKADLVDEFIITIIPVTIGGGIPLFLQGNPLTRLRLKGIKRFNDIVELHYVRKAAGEN